MDKNKYDFIQELLENKKLTPAQKERVFLLTKEEIKKDANNGKELNERVKKIEDKLTVDFKDVGRIKKQKDVKDQNRPENNKPIYYINCNNIPKFLKMLNANNYTKFLTHDVDSDDYKELTKLLGGKYEYLSHLNKIKEVFDVLTKKNSEFKDNHPNLKSINISKNLFKKIDNYLNNNNKGWGEKNNEMNWRHPDLLNWCNEHPENTPTPGADMGYEGFTFNDKTFNTIILDFKNEIHIRGNNSLDFILNKVLFEPQNDFRKKISIERDLDDSIEFFTDVEKLKQVVKQILLLIVSKHKTNDKPKVKISSKIDNGKIQLTILSVNSVINSNIATFRFGKDTPKLMINCNGICDLEIDAHFADLKSYRIPIWNRGRKIENDIVYDGKNKFNPSTSITELPEPVNGVLYKLTFDMGL